MCRAVSLGVVLTLVVPFPGCSGDDGPDPCGADPCHGHGTCVVLGDGHASCECDAGYAGEFCDSCAEDHVEFPADSGTCLDDPCRPDPCSGHGACSLDAGGAARCTCDAEYAGAACDSCADGHVEFPADSGTCVADPCRDVVCDHAECTEAYTILTADTGECVPDGVDSFHCVREDTVCPGGCHAGRCADAAYAAPGDLVINEIMLQPGEPPATQGQWFEVLNLSGGGLNLLGVTIHTTSQTLTFDEPAVVAADTAVVIGAADFSSAASPPAALPWNDLSVDPVSDQIEISSREGVLLDAVAWDASWSHLAGRSLTLSPALLAYTPASDNDDRARWCFAQAQHGDDWASPGAGNDACLPDWCEIDRPLATTVVVGSLTPDIYARVREAFLTDAGDFTPFLNAQIGFGAAGTSPDAGWTWSAADYNRDVAGAVEEEFAGKFFAPDTAGTYAFAYRTTLDNGASWLYCLAPDGTPGTLTVAEAGPYATLVISEYVEGSGHNQAVEIYNGTGMAVDLSDYSISIVRDGTSSGMTQRFGSVVIGDGQTYVICDNEAASSLKDLCDDDTAYLWYDGNDAVVLEATIGGFGYVIDAIGQAEFDPGASGWGSGDVTTTDHTLRRKCTVLEGDDDRSDAFDPVPEWDGYAIDTFDGLGSHCE
ncbi:MAG: lamin tail domain-containing protein [Deltaproteobacteria bacterium]|nr:lamin tail domain-containing protein [Deltaproteobacteria bacterium]